MNLKDFIRILPTNCNKLGKKRGRGDQMGGPLFEKNDSKDFTTEYEMVKERWTRILEPFKIDDGVS